MTLDADGRRARRNWLLSLGVVGASLGIGLLGPRLMNAGCAGWSIPFDGYGTVTCEGNRVVLEPERSLAPDETHAALAVSKSYAVPEGRAARISARVRTDEQLRGGSPPNAWEVAWLLWNYQDPDHFYALALKPNGWEISKQDPTYPGKQRFLASGTAPVFATGESYDVELDVDASSPGVLRVSVEVDGTELASIVDSEAPYMGGPVAAYAEDARAEVVLVSPDSQSTPSHSSTD